MTGRYEMKMRGPKQEVPEAVQGNWAGSAAFSVLGQKHQL